MQEVGTQREKSMIYIKYFPSYCTAIRARGHTHILIKASIQCLGLIMSQVIIAPIVTNHLMYIVNFVSTDKTITRLFFYLSCLVYNFS